ncbi:MAG: Dabb family protein [Polyangiaceae bacterium]|nr:Dabb family protein [Polyangiaceae bacterium]
MLSHVVIFWTKPGVPDAAEKLLAGMREYLAPIPGVTVFHAGKMVPSERAVVDQSYQIGLYVQVEDKAAEVRYQQHPLHLAFIEKCLKDNYERVVVYDFAD